MPNVPVTRAVTMANSSANSVQPYQFEPLMTHEELETFRRRTRNRREGDSDDEQREGSNEDSRIGNSRWCSCGICVPMPTTEESVCCQELCEARDNIGENSCVTSNQAFERVCLDPDVLQTALVLVANVRFHQYSQPI